MRASTATAWASLVGLGLALRPQLFGVSPLFPSIQAELGVPFSVVGLLVTVPVLAMGLASFAAPRVAARLDIGMTATLALVVLAAAGLVRAGMPGIAGLLLLSIPIGAASGIGGIVLPMIAKAAIPAGRAAAATGAYTASLQLGGAIAAALMIPIAVAAGGWRASLASIAVATGGLLVVWLVFRPRQPLGPVAEPVPAPTPTAASRAAELRWLAPTVAAFAILVLLFQGLNAWLPALLVEHGWSEADAGAVVAGLVLAQIPGTLSAGVLADRVGARRTYVAVAAVVVLAAVLLLALGVDGTWAWTLTAGFALGVIAPILLVLPVDFGADPQAVARSSATILGTGYALASVGPFAMGLVRDLTGSFTLSMLVLGGVAVGLLAVALAIPGQPRATGRDVVLDA